jgi:FdhD protein
MAALERRAIQGSTARLPVTIVGSDGVRSRRDRLATEEPLEIRAAGPGQEPVSVAVTMRTPGSDMELAAGFLFTEGLIEGRESIVSMRYCGIGEAEQDYNIVTVELREAFDASRLARNFYSTSSCGVCGKASIDQLEVRCAPSESGLVVARSVIESLPSSLEAAQAVFEQTGGLHATGLFTPEGELVNLREDVGRHNAMDKLVGTELLAGRLPASERVALVSGRTSFELVQKAAVAGIPLLCAISAPSTLAVATARRLGMTLVGFLRGNRFNVYAHAERIALDR